MLADPASGASSRRWQARHRCVCGWRNAAIMSGHWACMASACSWSRKKSTGNNSQVGSGPWVAAGLAGLRGRLGIAGEFRGKGYRSKRRGLDRLGVRAFRDRSHRPLHRPRKQRVASRGAATRPSKATRDRSVRPCRGRMGDVARMWQAIRA